MSSYFDQVTRDHQALATVEARLTLASKAVQRMRDYVAYIESHSPKTHAVRVFDLRQRVERMAVRKEYDEDGLYVIENMHTMAHEIGTAHIPVLHHPRARFGDNPYFADHNGIP